MGRGTVSIRRKIGPLLLTRVHDRFHASRPHKQSKYNPISHWRVSQKGISCKSASMRIRLRSHSISLQHLHFRRTAFILPLWGLTDYYESLILTVKGIPISFFLPSSLTRLCDVFCGYYGRLECVTWSPDGQYILVSL